MPLPQWMDCFGRCCGLRQGPHHQHYDAWLARERLNQVKRLEIKCADLTRENTELAGRLGQAVGILDSYHSFDLDQLGIGQDAQPQAGSQRRLMGLGSSNGSDHSQPQPATRLGSLAQQASGSRMGSLAVPPPGGPPPVLPRRIAGGGSLRPGAAGPSQSQGRAGSSLQFQPSGRTMATPPPRVIQQIQGSGARGALERAPSPPRALDIPSAQELDDLLRRSEPRRARTPPPRPERTSIDTVVDLPVTRRVAIPDDGASVASAPAAPRAGLPTIGEVAREGSGEIAPAFSGDGAALGGGPLGPLRSLSEGLGELTVPHAVASSRRAQTRKDGHESFDVGKGMGPRGGSFSFAPPTGVPVAQPMAPPSLPSVMVGDNTQPVRAPTPAPVSDTPRLSTEARGQPLTTHYSAETSPFARAAARMPSPDGKLPLSRHLHPDSRQG